MKDKKGKMMVQGDASPRQAERIEVGGNAESLSMADHRGVEGLIVRRVVTQESLQKLIYRISRNRTCSIHELSETEILLVWMCLGGDYAAA